MKLLIPGHGGLLAQAVFKVAEESGVEVVGLTEEELDITDESAVHAALEEVRPDAVINCAAWVNAETAQGDPDGARAVNTRGAGILAAAAAAVDASITYPSTDYVFDGQKGEPYVESDEPAPLSVYGETKADGERATSSANPRHFVCRTAWLYGPGGRNFPDTMLGLAEKQADIKVVNDQIGCPTYTPHLAAALVELAGTELYGVHHVAGSGECSWYEFAVEIFRQTGSSTRVLSCTTEEFPRPAKRPAYSVLGTEIDYPVVLPDWREGLASYLSERAAIA
jgi:dTDP-4-dehydrorhamnose reductase